MAHEVRSRPVGPKGLQAYTAETGTILAGLLCAAFKEHPASVQRRPGGAMWKNGLVGNRAFLAKIDTLKRAGLVGQKPGVRTNDASACDRPFGGLPTHLWARSLLIDLALRHGVRQETRETDWSVSRKAETGHIVVPDGDLIVIRTLDKTKIEAATAIYLPPDQIAQLERFRAWVRVLNACAASAVIWGCRAPMFRRHFVGGDLRLGGRLYAVGLDNFQTMTAIERGAILINSEPVVELDIRASFLSIFLALTGSKVLPDGDPYSVGGLSRDVVKAGITQSFATGKLLRRWSDRSPAEARRVSPEAVRAAVVSAYPAFGQPLTDILPMDLRARLPLDRHGWAVGQYLTFREGEVVASVAGHLAAQGTPSLPIHDGLIVPASAAKSTKDEMQKAFKVLIGVEPLVV